MIQIHDIKPIVKIPDFSIYFYYGIIVLFIIALCLILFFLFKFFKPKQKSQEYQYYQCLQNLDFTHSKKAAYTISKYGRILAQDERQKRLMDELDESLSIYKYKKDVTASFSNEIKTKFKVFMESLDV